MTEETVELAKRINDSAPDVIYLITCGNVEMTEWSCCDDLDSGGDPMTAVRYVKAIRQPYEDELLALQPISKGCGE